MRNDRAPAGERPDNGGSAWFLSHLPSHSHYGACGAVAADIFHSDEPPSAPSPQVGVTVMLLRLSKRMACQIVSCFGTRQICWETSRAAFRVLDGRCSSEDMDEGQNTVGAIGTKSVAEVDMRSENTN